MSNIKFDKERVVGMIVEYFHVYGEEKCTSLSMEKLYSEVVKYTAVREKKLDMPSFAQIRKLIISDLSEMGLFQKGDRLTSKAAYQLTGIYYNDEDVEDLLDKEYDVSVYYDSTIICILRLPPFDILDPIAVGLSVEKNKSKIYGRINLIRELCNSIKKRNPEVVLAVIPESNRMIHLNKNGEISKELSSLNPVCDTLCMFVKNTPEGRDLVEKMKPLTHSLTDTLTE